MLREEPRQPLGAHLPLDGARVLASPGLGEGGRVDVGREDLELRRARLLLQLLAKQHRERVRLLAGGAARHPDPDAVPSLPLQDVGDHDPLERPERLVVAEEARHVDRQVLGEAPGLVCIALEQRGVLPDGRDPGGGHPPLEAAKDRAPLVPAEVVPRRPADHVQRLPETFRLAPRALGWMPPPLRGELDERRRDLLDGEDLLHHPRRDRGGGHALVPRVSRELRERPAPVPLHGGDAEGAVGAGPREHDPDGVLALIFGEGGQERVHQQATALRLRRDEPQGTVLDEQGLPRRDDVHVVALDALPVARDLHRELRGARQDVGEAALVLGGEVLHEDVGQPAVRRQPSEEALERLEATRRGADTHDEETLRFPGTPAGFLRVARVGWFGFAVGHWAPPLVRCSSFRWQMPCAGVLSDSGGAPRAVPLAGSTAEISF